MGNPPPYSCRLGTGGLGKWPLFAGLGRDPITLNPQLQASGHADGSDESTRREEAMMISALELSSPSAGW